MGFSCTFSKEVWRKVGSWLGISLTFNCVGEEHFVQFRRLMKGRTTWCLWLMRNDILFKGRVGDVSVVIDSIKTFL